MERLVAMHAAAGGEYLRLDQGLILMEAACTCQER
jgi:hypothetical protein